MIYVYITMGYPSSSIWIMAVVWTTIVSCNDLLQNHRECRERWKKLAYYQVVLIFVISISHWLCTGTEFGTVPCIVHKIGQNCENVPFTNVLFSLPVNCLGNDFCFANILYNFCLNDVSFVIMNKKSGNVGTFSNCPQCFILLPHQVNK